MNTATSSISTLNENLAGSAQLTEQEENTVIAVLDPLVDSLTTFLETLDGKVKDKDILLSTDLASIGSAANALVNAFDNLLTGLGGLGITLKDETESDSADDDDANETLQADIEDDMLVKYFRFRRH